MDPESGQNFVNKSEFQCLSVDGASSPMNLPVLEIVPDFSNISSLDSTESLIISGHDDLPINLFSDQCSVCRCTRIKSADQEFTIESPKLKAPLLPRRSNHLMQYSSCVKMSNNLNSRTCLCVSCQSERESNLHHKKVLVEFQKIWVVISEAIGWVYAAESVATVINQLDIPLLRNQVAKLCRMNAHYLFKKLEKRCRQIVINMKIHILKKLAPEITSETAYHFTSTLFRRYSCLCTACEVLADFLSPLVEQHLGRFNSTWQLHNKYLFYCVVFNEPIVQKCLPDAVKRVEQELVNFQQCQQEKLSKEQLLLMDKYSEVLVEHKRFVEEMTNVAQSWKSCQQEIEKYDENYAIEKMRVKRHYLLDGVEFIKNQRQFLKEIQGAPLVTDAFDDTKKLEFFQKCWIASRGDETQCPNCKDVKCSYNETGMSHLITCGIISPDIISEEGLAPLLTGKQEENPFECDFNEYPASASVRSSSSSSDDSFLADDPHRGKECAREDAGEGSSEDDDEEDDDEDDEDDDEDDDDDDDFHDAQQIHLSDYCPSVENASSELVNRCSQQFLLQRPLVEDCTCMKCSEESLCLLSYAEKSQNSLLKFVLKGGRNGEDDDDNDDDYDIHEGGLHTSRDLEYATMAQLTGADLLLKGPSNFIDYLNEPQFLHKSTVEGDANHRFLLSTLGQQCAKTKCSQAARKHSMFPTNERQPPSSPASNGEIDALLQPDLNSATFVHPTDAPRSPARAIEHKTPKTTPGPGKLLHETGSQKIKSLRNSETWDPSSDKKSGKDRSTQHPEKILNANDDKTSTPSACNLYQVALKHLNPCQKQRPQTKTVPHQTGSCDDQSLPSQQKQGAFARPQQPTKQQSFQCRAPSCNGHMVGAGDGGMDKEECDASPHQHLSSCEVDDKSSGNQKDPNAKPHCECWHCEFFGHETQSNAPTSKNFAECRDRLRQKLKKKQNSTKTTSKTLSHSSASPKNVSPAPGSGLKSVDELIDYINGGKNDADRSVKERRKDLGTKKKSGKQKKTKENGSRISEVVPNDLLEEKKSANQSRPPIIRNPSPSAPSRSQHLEAKNTNKLKSCESGTTSLTPPSSSRSSLENSVPTLKIDSSSKKFKLLGMSHILVDRDPNERKRDSVEKSTSKKESQKSNDSDLARDKATYSPLTSRSNAGHKTPSTTPCSRQTLISDLKMSLTPPSSPCFKASKADHKKAPECNYKQKNCLTKDASKTVSSQIWETKESPSNPASHSKQNKNSSACLLNGNSGTDEMHQRAKAENCSLHLSTTCNNINSSLKNHSSALPSPPGSSRNKKQKKRNKTGTDLSFEEIFRPNDEEDVGDDDREIEEFKRFCFNTPPMAVREKLRVSLNMKDIFNRRKLPQGCNL